MIQQGTPQQNGKFSLANINVCSTLSSELFVPQFDTDYNIVQRITSQVALFKMLDIFVLFDST